jgi:tetratricopeptide (TPR) repeat protein
MATISEALAIAVQHHQAGRLQAAEQVYRQILAVEPALAEAHNNLGVALQDQGKPDEAVACYRRALTLKPGFTEAHNNLGNALKCRGQLDEAIASYRRALELKPEFAQAHYNLGNAFQEQGNLDDAVACYCRALELKPDHAGTHYNLGNALKDQRKLDHALACFRRALELNPDHAEAHWTRAFTWLLAGDWQRGWPEYEWRWRTKEFVLRRFPQPWWEGESLAGKTILLHAEQGLGDTIQFIRYASIVKQLGAAVIVECQELLLGLLDSCPGIDQLVAQGDALPAFDVHAPLLSLPRILKTSAETIPATIPYLVPKPAIVERWRTRLIEIDGFKIGIAWQGNPTFRGDRFRSFPLRYFAPLAQVPGVCLLSLQKGAGSGQLAEVRDLFAVTDLGDRLHDFTDTAAVMKNLDLVITSDTAAAHLAGALGVPVWVALSFAADWRWLLDRCDCPWYPTMRLFRQRESGDWRRVFEEINSALHEAASRPTRP